MPLAKYLMRLKEVISEVGNRNSKANLLASLEFIEIDDENLGVFAKLTEQYDKDKDYGSREYKYLAGKIKFKSTFELKKAFEEIPYPKNSIEFNELVFNYIVEYKNGRKIAKLIKERQASFKKYQNSFASIINFINIDRSEEIEARKKYWSEYGDHVFTSNDELYRKAIQIPSVLKLWLKDINLRVKLVRDAFDSITEQRRVKRDFIRQVESIAEGIESEINDGNQHRKFALSMYARLQNAIKKQNTTETGLLSEFIKDAEKYRLIEGELSKLETTQDPLTPEQFIAFQKYIVKYNKSLKKHEKDKAIALEGIYKGFQQLYVEKTKADFVKKDGTIIIKPQSISGSLIPAKTRKPDFFFLGNNIRAKIFDEKFSHTVINITGLISRIEARTNYFAQTLQGNLDGNENIILTDINECLSILDEQDKIIREANKKITGWRSAINYTTKNLLKDYRTYNTQLYLEQLDKKITIAYSLLTLFDKEKESSLSELSFNTLKRFDTVFDALLIDLDRIKASNPDYKEFNIISAKLEKLKSDRESASLIATKKILDFICEKKHLSKSEINLAVFYSIQKADKPRMKKDIRWIIGEPLKSDVNVICQIINDEICDNVSYALIYSAVNNVCSRIYLTAEVGKKTAGKLIEILLEKYILPFCYSGDASWQYKFVQEYDKEHKTSHLSHQLTINTKLAINPRHYITQIFSNRELIASVGMGPSSTIRIDGENWPVDSDHLYAALDQVIHLKPGFLDSIYQCVLTVVENKYYNVQDMWLHEFITALCEARASNQLVDNNLAEEDKLLIRYGINRLEYLLDNNFIVVDILEEPFVKKHLSYKPFKNAIREFLLNKFLNEPKYQNYNYKLLADAYLMDDVNSLNDQLDRIRFEKLQELVELQNYENLEKFIINIKSSFIKFIATEEYSAKFTGLIQGKIFTKRWHPVFAKLIELGRNMDHIYQYRLLWLDNFLQQSPIAMNFSDDETINNFEDAEDYFCHPAKEDSLIIFKDKLIQFINNADINNVSESIIKKLAVYLEGVTEIGHEFSAVRILYNTLQNSFAAYKQTRMFVEDLILSLEHAETDADYAEIRSSILPRISAYAESKCQVSFEILKVFFVKLKEFLQKYVIDNKQPAFSTRLAYIYNSFLNDSAVESSIPEVAECRLICSNSNRIRNLYTQLMLWLGDPDNPRYQNILFNEEAIRCIVCGFSLQFREEIASRIPDNCSPINQCFKAILYSESNVLPADAVSQIKNYTIPNIPKPLAEEGIDNSEKVKKLLAEQAKTQRDVIEKLESIRTVLIDETNIKKLNLCLYADKNSRALAEHVGPFKKEIEGIYDKHRSFSFNEFKIIYNKIRSRNFNCEMLKKNIISLQNVAILIKIMKNELDEEKFNHYIDKIFLCCLQTIRDAKLSTNAYVSLNSSGLIESAKEILSNLQKLTERVAVKTQQLDDAGFLERKINDLAHKLTIRRVGKVKANLETGLVEFREVHIKNTGLFSKWFQKSYLSNLEIACDDITQAVNTLNKGLSVSSTGYGNAIGGATLAIAGAVKRANNKDLERLANDKSNQLKDYKKLIR